MSVVDKAQHIPLLWFKYVLQCCYGKDRVDLTNLHGKVCKLLFYGIDEEMHSFTRGKEHPSCFLQCQA